MFGDKCIQSRGALVTIDVIDEESGWTSCNANVALWPPGPPFFYLSEIDGRIFKAVCRSRMLSRIFTVGVPACAFPIADGMERENKKTVLGVFERSLEQTRVGSALLERGHRCALTRRSGRTLERLVEGEEPKPPGDVASDGIVLMPRPAIINLSLTA
jgi:hypothetical protein